MIEVWTNFQKSSTSTFCLHLEALVKWGPNNNESDEYNLWWCIDLIFRNRDRAKEMRKCCCISRFSSICPKEIQKWNFDEGRRFFEEEVQIADGGLEMTWQFVIAAMIKLFYIRWYDSFEGKFQIPGRRRRRLLKAKFRYQLLDFHPSRQQNVVVVKPNFFSTFRKRRREN